MKTRRSKVGGARDARPTNERRDERRDELRPTQGNPRPRRDSRRGGGPRDELVEAGPRSVLGRRFVLEGLASGTITRVHVDRAQTGKLVDVLEAARDAGVEVREVLRETLDARAGDLRHQGVIGDAAPFRYRELDEVLASEAPFLVALDEITDPHNFGAIVRSAVAFGVDGVLVPAHRSAGVTAVVVRASAGATEHARIAIVTNLQRTLADLADRGLQVVGLDMEGDVTVDALPPAPFGRVVVVGSEGKGLRRLVRERCTHVAAIPQVGPVSSLNASVAAGIALYEASRAR